MPSCGRFRRQYFDSKPVIVDNNKEYYRGYLHGITHPNMKISHFFITSCFIFAAHWITNDFESKNHVLHASHFPETHTTVNIVEKLDTMWEEWKIDAHRQHVLVRDGRHLCGHLNHSSHAMNVFKDL